MSSYSRRFVLLSAAATVAACGFTPAYAPSGPAAKLQGAIEVDTPDAREAYLLTRQIEERLGRGNPARYGLAYSIALSEDPIAISAANVTTRYNILGTVTWALRDLDDGKILLSGKAESFTGYSASGTTVATQAAQRDAEARLITILADQIITRLTAEAGKLPA